MVAGSGVIPSSRRASNDFMQNVCAIERAWWNRPNTHRFALSRVVHGQKKACSTRYELSRIEAARRKSNAKARPEPSGDSSGDRVTVTVTSRIVFQCSAFA